MFKVVGPGFATGMTQVQCCAQQGDGFRGALNRCGVQEHDQKLDDIRQNTSGALRGLYVTAPCAQASIDFPATHRIGYLPITDQLRRGVSMLVRAGCSRYVGLGVYVFQRPSEADFWRRLHRRAAQQDQQQRRVGAAVLDCA